MKAVVMEVRGSEAAILMMDGTVRVVRGRYEVGQKINYVAPSRPSMLQWAAAILVAVLLLGGSAGLWVNENYIAYAEVSLDVGPSPIVYTLNRRNRVLSVRAVRDDGADIVEAMDGDGLKFKPIGDAVERTVAVLEEKGYMGIEADDYVLASVATDDERRRDALTEQVDAAMIRAKESDPTLEYRVEPTDRATARAASEMGMSPGRYNAWRDHGDADKPEEFAAMPVRDIFSQDPHDPAPEKSDGDMAPVAEPQSGMNPAPVEQRDVTEAAPRDGGSGQPDSKPLTEPAKKPAESRTEGEPARETDFPTGIEAYFADENDRPGEGAAPSAGEGESAPPAEKDGMPSEPAREERGAPERDSAHFSDRGPGDRGSGQRDGGPGPGGGRP